MTRTVAIVSLLLLAGCAGTIGLGQTVTIKDDPGGVITNFQKKFQRWRAQGKFVIVDGYCGSSCTMVAGMIPASNLCVTPRAVFGFHGSWVFCGKCENPKDTHLMTDTYPPALNAWLEQHGGLKSYKHMIYLRYPETSQFFRMCS